MPSPRKEHRFVAHPRKKIANEAKKRSAIQSTSVGNERDEPIDFNNDFQSTSVTQQPSMHELGTTYDHTHTDSLRQIDTLQSKLNRKCDEADCSKRFEIINDKLNEILAKFVVMERAFMGNLHLNKIDPSENMENSDETKTQLFFVTNRLPAENENDLKDFEVKLKDDSFRTSAVCNTHNSSIYVHKCPNFY